MEGISVLLVDDEKHLARNIGKWFQSKGCRVHTAFELEEALSALEALPELDLLITDVYLQAGRATPGGQILAKYCAEKRPNLPVILLTGKPSMDLAIAGIRTHAFDFLTKPVHMPTLWRRAQKAITEMRLRARLSELERDNKLLSAILPNAIEAKDPTTRGHSDRVVRYADTLAIKSGVGEEERRDLRLAARLHDVGKIGIPEAILTKPGPLDREERLVIQQHPEIGFKIIEPLKDFPRVRDWVYQHHERWDGRGYPQGLKGEEVALPGRILILAEVYDALATTRSYKKPWSNEKIADFFEEEAGHHFDPDLGKIVAEGVREKGQDFFQAFSGNSEQEGGQTLSSPAQ
ncbi:MAG TPA: HD domain-containing protein [Planctomycetes bacterium]|nr:HD domain-containing protein [Planctomycetota bacterium]